MNARIAIRSTGGKAWYRRAGEDGMDNGGGVALETRELDADVDDSGFCSGAKSNFVRTSRKRGKLSVVAC